MARAESSENKEGISAEELENLAQEHLKAVEAFYLVCSDDGGESLVLERVFDVEGDANEVPRQVSCKTEAKRVLTLGDEVEKWERIRMARLKSLALSDGDKEMLRQQLGLEPSPCTENEKRERSLSVCMSEENFLVQSTARCAENVGRGVALDSYYNGTLLCDLAGMCDPTPAAAPANISRTLLQTLDQSIRDDFGCQERDAKGKCLKGMRNWDCASCQQRLTAICGFGGYLLGEPVFGLLLGMSAGAAKPLVVDPALWALKKSGIPALAARGWRCSNFGPLMREKYQRSREKWVNSAAYRKLKRAQREIAANRLVSSGLKVIKIGAKGHHLLWPLKKYLRAIDHATEVGFSLGKKVGG